ncbi:MAG: hypothetical protein IT389_04880 [Nitrospira sp.]|nr:hypothetical protein [Nitrospira sp.]
MTRQGSSYAWTGLVGAALLWAAVSTAAAPPESTETPDADFLEFLGNWHMGDGRWVDPFHAVELSSAETVAPQKRQQAGPAQEPPRTNRPENRDGPDRQSVRPIDPTREMKR